MKYNKIKILLDYGTKLKYIKNKYIKEKINLLKKKSILLDNNPKKIN